jgi:hypothetical protein
MVYSADYPDLPAPGGYLQLIDVAFLYYPD